MKRELLCLPIVFAAAAAVAAQDRAPDISRSTVFLEGCLQSPDKASLHGTSRGSAAVPANGGVTIQEVPPFYLLVDARPAGRETAAATSGDAVGTAGKARTRNADGSVTSESDQPGRRKTYALVGDHPELAGYIGHRVSVSGTVVQSAAPDQTAAGRIGRSEVAVPGSTDPPSQPNATAASPSVTPSAISERFSVTSIRSVADRCSP